MALQIQTASTISEVIDQLDRIIDWSIRESNRIGYFACLYRKVTVAVQAGIQNGTFEDGPRMERLDVLFANRFLEAFRQHQNLENCTGAWLLAFQQARVWRPLVLQHLMLGMNAHINLDLGVAAAATMQGKPIENIKDDFYKINDILLDMIDEVQDQLSLIFPLLKRIDLIGRFDEILAGAGIDIARRQAWKIAQAFAAHPAAEWDDKILELDQKILKTGQRILQPGKGVWISLGLFVIRLGEYHTVGKKISLLR
ncbi:DUF5995 family protein [Flavilitoribacter nigricans]|uniref:Uncharacterized protein n=1 Tax=Flavilitoribacter nigricans (strain ATCC 23147 / DSM 23189 / NBRC 102662 / NCIMB 1420 / SS-2) TaxID=1122177 RepID=A0A2D0N5E5_FLAN2|nr:DUF5995 family protein [Flavilitoribacter nigricans]PHN03610.1 hypothetical protein CRP01_25465 [Flavilitoribacter nigricans DSM 23189 = NBRC 102662]